MYGEVISSTCPIFAFLDNYKLPDAEYTLRQSAYTAYQKDEPIRKPEPVQPKPEPQQPKKEARKGLFLKVSSADGIDCERSKKMCSIFEGNVPLILYFEDTKTYNFSTGIYTSASPDLITGLKKMLGEKNVVLKL